MHVQQDNEIVAVVTLEQLSTSSRSSARCSTQRAQSILKFRVHAGITSWIGQVWALNISAVSERTGPARHTKQRILDEPLIRAIESCSAPATPYSRRTMHNYEPGSSSSSESTTAHHVFFPSGSCPFTTGTTNCEWVRHQLRDTGCSPPLTLALPQPWQPSAFQYLGRRRRHNLPSGLT